MMSPMPVMTSWSQRMAKATAEKARGRYQMRTVEYEVARIISKVEATGAETATEIILLIDDENAKAANDRTAKICEWLKATGMQEAAEAAWAQFNPKAAK